MARPIHRKLVFQSLLLLLRYLISTDAICSHDTYFCHVPQELVGVAEGLI